MAAADGVLIAGVVVFYIYQEISSLCQGVGKDLKLFERFDEIIGQKPRSNLPITVSQNRHLEIVMHKKKYSKYESTSVQY